MGLLAAYSFEQWGGINTGVPSNHVARTQTPYSENFTFYDGLAQQPNYSQYFFNNYNTTPDGRAIEIPYYFVDANNAEHHGIITQETLYDLSIEPPGSVALTLPGLGKFSVSIQVFENKLFIVNGSTYVMYYDGITQSIQVATNLWGARYIFELASSLCIAYVNELSDGLFPQRVRWCVAGNITQWDPTVYTGAGFEDLLECPDGITGVMNTSPVAYIIRSNGITQMVPTGVGTAAFNFDHLWASRQGIGDVLGTTVANYGGVGFVVSSDDIYIITSSSYNKIATAVKNTLYPQIVASLVAGNNIFAWLEPLISGGQPYLRYRIAIPYTGGTYIWNFNTDNNDWDFENLIGYTVTGQGGYIVNFYTQSPLYTNSPLIPVLNGGNYFLLKQGSPGGINTIFFPGQINFKTEYDAEYKSITVRRVFVRYKYQGNTAGEGVPVAIQVQGMYGNSVLQALFLADPAQTKQYYGGFPSPSVAGNYYIAAFTNVLLTDYEYTISLTIEGPLVNTQPSVQITDVFVFGDVGKETGW